MAALPIIFIEPGPGGPLLNQCLDQARRCNPGALVYLIGADQLAVDSAVLRAPIGRFMAGAHAFEGAYQHLGTRPYGEELARFQRWFILHDFLEANGYQQGCYLESDVLLYANVADDLVRFRYYELALTTLSGSVMLVNRLAGLRRYCDFMMDAFTRRDRYQYDRVVAHYVAAQRNRHPEGPGDMLLMDFFREETLGDVGELGDITGGALYDPDTSRSEPGLRMQGSHKLIEWQAGVPYGHDQATGTSVRFHALHLKGGADRYPGLL
jgi:hypothetical protein